MPKIWTNSGDSYVLEPSDLWESWSPKRLADLTPKSGKDPDGEYETVHADGVGSRAGLPGRGSAHYPRPGAPDWHRAQGFRAAHDHATGPCRPIWTFGKTNEITYGQPRPTAQPAVELTEPDTGVLRIPTTATAA